MLRITRPLEVKFLFLFIALVGLWNLYQFIQAITSWHMFAFYGQSGIAVYLAISGGVWFIASTLLDYGLLFCPSWTWRATMCISLAYIIWQVIDRLAVQKDRAGDFFVALVGFLMITIFYSLLFSKNAKGYLHEK